MNILLELQPIYTSEKMEACRSWSEPSLCLDNTLADEGAEKRREEFGCRSGLSGYCSDPGYIDRGNTSGNVDPTPTRENQVLKKKIYNMHILFKLKQ